MRILDLETTPAWTYPYLNAMSGGRGAHVVQLPVLHGRARGLPECLDALVIASDLQGRELPGDAPPRLLGVAFAEELEARSLMGDLPPLDRVGVLLGGDLYVAPGASKRGGYGDVRDVWRAFHGKVRWVAGVGGNHDGFGEPGLEGLERFADRGVGHVLDGRIANLDGLRVGGVSGIVGHPRKVMRRFLDEFLELVGAMIDASVDVLVLHEGPAIPGVKRRGNPEINELLSVAAPELLVVCGHTHWPIPMRSIHGNQVLNCEGRVVVLWR